MGRLIDADALLKDINDYPYGYRGMIKDTIARQPTVEPKQGHWTNISISANEYEPSSAQCNLCGARVYNNFSSVINYCPNCGAKMGEDRDYEHAVEQLEHNMTFESTYDPEDGSM